MMVKIAAVQMKIKYANIQSNIKKAEYIIKKANKEDTEIISFPEDFLGIVGKDAHYLAEPIPGKYTDIFSRLSQEYSINLVAGSVYERTRKGIFNTAVFVNEKGEIAGKYRKINLWLPEREHLLNGKRVSVIKTRFGKIGLQICWDLAFPNITRELARKGCKIVFCPSFWSVHDNNMYRNSIKFNAESRFVDACVQSRAWENNLIFVFANGCGWFAADKWKCRLFGHTQIASPIFGNVGKISKPNKEDVLVREIDLSVLKEAEKCHRIRESLMYNTF